MLDLTTGKEWKKILLFVFPMLIGNVFQQMYNIVDSIIVGNFIGKEALASVGAAFPVTFVFISLVIGVSVGSGAIISQYYGAKNYEKVKASVDTMFVFLFLSSIVITAIGLIFSEQIYKMLGLPNELLPQATEYLNITLFGMITVFGFNGVSAALRGVGDSKTPLYFLIIATFLNIVLDLLFVIVFKFGVAGVAWATVIAQTVTFLISIVYLNRTNEYVKFSLLKINFDKQIFFDSIKISIPSGLQHTFVALGMMALFSIVNKFGTSVIAAYTIAGRINTFVTLPAMTFSAALSTFTGQNLGANKIERIRRGYLSTWLMTSILSVSMTILLIIFREEIMRVFINNEEVIKIGANYIVIVSCFYLIFSTMFITNGLFRGAGATLIPMFITIFSLWIVQIPLSYFLSTLYGVNGIWWGIPSAWIIGMILSFMYYLYGNWKKNVVVKHINDDNIFSAVNTPVN